MEQWIVARTKQGREKWAAENVVNVGFEVFLPMLEEERLRRVNGNPRRVVVVRPIFPDYLFVQTDGPWHVLLNTFGIHQVLMWGDRPAVMPEHELLRLKAMVGEDGVVRLPKPAERFQSGQSVYVVSGSLAGTRGVYQGQAAKHRVRVLLELLGGKTPTLISEDALEAA